MNWLFLIFVPDYLASGENLHHCVSCKKSFWSADPVSKYCFINFQCRISLIKSGAFLSASNKTRKYVSSTGCAIPSGGGVRTQFVLQLRILYQENSGSFFFGRHSGLNRSDFEQHLLLQQYKLIQGMSRLTFCHWFLVPGTVYKQKMKITRLRYFKL